MLNTQTILQQLSDQGFKKTKVRELLIGELLKLKKPLDAQALQDFLSDQKLAVNKTTVYRELQFLLEQGIIVEINFGDNKRRYEIAGLAHHHHLICNNCQGIEDVFVDQDLVKLEKKIAKEKNFAIHSHSLEFFGLCRHCLWDKIN